MSKRWILWWIANIFLIALFAVGTAFVWFREVDGAGVTQTTELKLVALLVLVIAFIFPVIIQIVWLILNFVVGNNKKATKLN